MLIEEDDDALPTRYVKARPVNFFKHELEALKQKTKLESLDWSAIKRIYRLKAYCSGLVPNEKPLTYAIHHVIGHCYQTLNHT